jgi:hypothetical protein
MKKIKSMSIIMTMVIIVFALSAGKVMAYSDVYFTGIGGMTFSGSGAATGSTFVFDLGGVISSATTPAGISTTYTSDAVVGKYINFFDTGTTTQAIFTLGSDLGNGVWSLGNQEVTVAVSSKALGSGTQYFSGTLIASTIDFTTGTITWDIGTTAATINTSVTSSTLGSLANSDNDTHYAAITSMIFDITNSSLIAWLSGSSTEGDASYTAAKITVSPEPGEWALMLIGLCMIGFSIYRRQNAQAALALPEWQNVRMT